MFPFRNSAKKGKNSRIVFGRFLSKSSLSGRLLRAPLGLVPRGAVLRILRGPLRGFRWIAGSSTAGCWLGWYEIEFQKLLAHHLQPGWIFYDIGANVGFYTLLASKFVGEGGSVISFEPNPRNMEFLRRHIELNGLINVRVIQAAVSDTSGRESFSLNEGPEQGHLSTAGELLVETAKLDDLLQNREIPPPDAVKIDIEGAELRALHGGRKLLRLHPPLIFLATHGYGNHEACCALLSDLGYEIEEISSPRSRSGFREVIARAR